MPVVYLNQRVRGVPSVSIDDAAGTRDGVRHLRNLGHRRIAFVRPENRTGFRYSAIDRVDGFRAAMDEAGVPPEEQQVITAADVGSADEVVATALSTPVPPTALVADSDELAIGILGAMSRVGLRAPEDLSLLGFDDHALAARLGLSTIAQPVEALGTEAAELALTLAAGAVPARRVLVVPTRLVLRRTTGRVP
jgi:DNA-binding LacI/PurR family transcriptional regulator